MVNITFKINDILGYGQNRIFHKANLGHGSDCSRQRGANTEEITRYLKNFKYYLQRTIHLVYNCWINNQDGLLLWRT